MEKIRRIPLRTSYKMKTSGGAAWQSYTQNLDTLEKVTTVNNRNWRNKSDGGSNFDLVRTKIVAGPGYVNNSLMQGNYVCNSVTEGWYNWYGDFALPVRPTKTALDAAGTTAIARSLPTNPAASLSVAIGELGREGLPRYIGSTAFKKQVHAAHKAGDEYLNYQFGWLPLVSELRKFAFAVKHKNEIMRSYMKYSDKQIRRSYEFPSRSFNYSFNSRHYLGGHSTLWADTRVTDSNEYKQWFKGAFVYHVPTPVGFSDTLQYHSAQASKLLGLELTPEVVWNLAPWSWAVDWFTNTGDVMHNISRLGKDGLAMRYGYIMNHGTRSQEIIANGSLSGQLNDFQSYYRATWEIKSRQKATPYGFGLTFNGLNNTQKAVIAALGLTRAF